MVEYEPPNQMAYLEFCTYVLTKLQKGFEEDQICGVAAGFFLTEDNAPVHKAI